MKTIYCLFLLLWFTMAWSCMQKKPGKPAEVKADQQAVQSYHLDDPSKQWNLPGELKEISGIAFVDEKHFMVIEDLHPALYLLRTDSNTVIEKRIPFEQTDKTKVDIEDVALHGDTAFALWSHGEIFRVTGWRSSPVVKVFSTSLNKEENTEGICYDPVTKNLLIACKDASGLENEKKSTRAVYSFNIATGKLEEKPALLIRKKDLKSDEGETLHFYPSAIGVHPATKDIYLLSSKENKCLAVYDRNGRLKAFSFLNDQLFPQPEGLCFAPDGTLYISSQGRHGQPPRIFAFKEKAL